MPNVRRSLTITEENDNRVQRRRAMFLGLAKPLDLDYTATVNLLIEIGDLAFKQNWNGTSITLSINDIIAILSKYLLDQNLKDEALVDQLQDWLLRNLPKVAEQYKKTQQTNILTKAEGDIKQRYTT